MPKNQIKLETEYLNTSKKTKTKSIKVIIDYNHDINSKDLENIMQDYKSKYISGYDEIK